jgi:LPXTG-motif cell wall-anchored protein
MFTASTHRRPFRIAAAVLLTVFFTAGYLAVAEGIATANPVDVSWSQGCVGTYVKKLTVTLHNRWTTPLTVTIANAASPFSPTIPAGATVSFDVFTIDTTHGAGHTSASVSSTQADLHGTLSASLQWADHECGPAVPPAAAPPTTVSVCGPGQHWENNPPPSQCYPDVVVPVTTTAPPAPEESTTTTTAATVDATTTVPAPPQRLAPPKAKPAPPTASALPPTGSNDGTIVVAGVSALLVGGGLLLVGRRRNRAS